MDISKLTCIIKALSYEYENKNYGEFDSKYYRNIYYEHMMQNNQQKKYKKNINKYCLIEKVNTSNKIIPEEYLQKVKELVPGSKMIIKYYIEHKDCCKLHCWCCLDLQQLYFISFKNSKDEKIEIKLIKIKISTSKFYNYIYYEDPKIVDTNIVLSEIIILFPTLIETLGNIFGYQVLLHTINLY